MSVFLILLEPSHAVAQYPFLAATRKQTSEATSRPLLFPQRFSPHSRSAYFSRVREVAESKR